MTLRVAGWLLVAFALGFHAGGACAYARIEHAIESRP